VAPSAAGAAKARPGFAIRSPLPAQSPRIPPPQRARGVSTVACEVWTRVSEGQPNKPSRDGSFPRERAASVVRWRRLSAGRLSASVRRFERFGVHDVIGHGVKNYAAAVLDHRVDLDFDLLLIGLGQMVSFQHADIEG
jgi:hypothetical protein